MVNFFKIIPGSRFSALLAGFFVFVIQTPSEAATSTSGLTTYFIRVMLALCLLVGISYILIRYIRPSIAVRESHNVKVIAALRLGREMLYIIQCGPDVIALLSGGNNSKVVGKWRKEDWLQGDVNGEKKCN
jgi:hypothetical protein